MARVKEPQKCPHVFVSSMFNDVSLRLTRVPTHVSHVIQMQATQLTAEFADLPPFGGRLG